MNPAAQRETRAHSRSLEFLSISPNYSRRDSVPDSSASFRERKLLRCASLLDIPEGSAAPVTDSVGEAIERQREQYSPDGAENLSLPLADWACAQKLMGRLPAARALTTGTLVHNG
jgi:hypothetical protein